MVRRGEIWTVAGGVYAGKPRPALVIQDDAFDTTSSVTVIPLTTVSVDSPTRVLVPATSLTGIQRDSYAMADKVTTVRRNHLREHAGRLPTALLLDVERALMVVLGLAR